MPNILKPKHMALLEPYVGAGDAVSYYELLSNRGYAYADLALGVVMDDGLRRTPLRARLLLRSTMANLSFKQQVSNTPMAPSMLWQTSTSRLT